jgi:hypothetical protein
MAGCRWAAGVQWRLEIAENEAREGRETYAYGLGKAPKDQGSGHLDKHLPLSDLRLIKAPFGSTRRFGTGVLCTKANQPPV